MHVPPEKLERLIQMAVQNRPAASDDEYARRLAVCSGCQGLQYGTTCRYCGCLVAVRASQRDAGCPYPLQSRWESAGPQDAVTS
ncbi:DUF6171 family protein [Paenibacillus pinistramenti]|uniref:DUF6171 family protein n=1 Tax=Paenibacillus pinistramenti TaxID=1768003 RepID=UPI001EF014DD|nr:DUF6171 family protein [Paenibacillus pinistramenti]